MRQTVSRQRVLVASVQNAKVSVRISLLRQGAMRLKMYPLHIHRFPGSCRLTHHPFTRSITSKVAPPHTDIRQSALPEKVQREKHSPDTQK